ncbi:MAG: hypothetical protein IRZ28_18060 [Steroidobacteraceae bacterium]|nr:hypothetical protein [Steroidobacteraceae bacterium]
MTALNLAIRSDRALIVSDSLVSGADEPLFASKVVTAPHLGLIGAANGSHDFACAWRSWLSWCFPRGTTAEDVEACAGDFGRDAWLRRRCSAPSSLFLVGVAGERVFATVFASPDFSAQRLEPGVYYSPNLAAETGDAREAPERTPPTAEERAADLALPWSDWAAAALTPIRRQRAAHPERIGGAVIATELDAGGAIRQYRVLDLEALEAPAS